MSVPPLGLQIEKRKPVQNIEVLEEKPYLHQRMFLYHKVHGARLFESDVPLPTEPGWCDTPKKADEFVETPRLPQGVPVMEPDHEHGERTDRGRATRNRGIK